MWSWWRIPHNPGPYDDDWEDQPSQGGFYQFGLGIMLPLVMLIVGIGAIATQQAEYGRVPLKLTGLNATAFGVAATAAALFAHCHYFWGNIYNQAWFAVLGKILAACAFIVALATLIVRVGVLGIN